MNRNGFLIVLALLVLALALQNSALATRVVNAYVPIYQGIEYASGTDDSPRLMKAFAVRIDLTNPNVTVFASHDNGANPYETALQTTPDFLTDHGLKTAINTCFFNAGLSPNTDILGLLISNGTIVSPNDYGLEGELCFDVNKVASFVNRDYTPSGFYNGCGTADIIVSNGINVGVVNDAQPRTGAGLSADNTKLIFVVIDGRQSGWSDGATYYDEAQWLIDFGAYTGGNFDGGGSTCLAIAGWWGGPIVNRPCYGYARAVGANLGVTSINLPTNPPYMFDADTMGWTPGPTSSAIMYAPAPGWPGCMYFDQTGNDCFVYSPPTSFVGAANEVITVNMYPQNGSTSSHDMQVFWKTLAEPYFDAAKSSPVTNYTAQNSWAVVNLDVNNAKWTGQTVTQLRLDVDNTNHGNRWIVDYVTKNAAPANEIIIDNPAGVPTGPWSTGTSSSDKYGADYRYHSTATSSTDVFTWTPTIGTAGNYQVYAWWPQGSNRSAAAPYTVYYNGGNATIPCNQQAGGGAWNSLGTYNFAAGTSGNVTLGVVAPTGFSVMADAVRFVKKIDSPASAAVGTVTVNSIVWNWGNVTGESGFRVYDAVTGGNLKGSTGVDVLTLPEGSLAANTSYTRYVCAFDANGESARTALPTTVTLSVAPTTSTVTCDKPVSTPQSSPTFTFTAVGGFGAGTVSSYKYVWDTSSTHTWTGSEATWNSGTKACTATSEGSWYMHVKGYNSVGVENGTLNLGPYVYSVPVDIIIDNPAGVATGSWSTSTSATDKYGADYRNRSTSPGATQTFAWTPNLPVAGNYTVYAWWPQGANRTTAAPYTIYYNGGSALVPCNQQSSGGMWNNLGTYNFVAGTSGYIKVGADAPSGFQVMADAVRFVKP